MMTNKRARELIAMIKVEEPDAFIVNSWWGSFVNDYREALKMAVKALEDQPATVAKEYKDGSASREF